MKIKIGNSEIAVPEFISSASSGNKKEFHAFLKQALAANGAKVRDCERVRRENEALNRMKKWGNPFGSFADLCGGKR